MSHPPSLSLVSSPESPATSPHPPASVRLSMRRHHAPVPEEDENDTHDTIVTHVHHPHVSAASPSSKSSSLCRWLCCFGQHAPQRKSSSQPHDSATYKMRVAIVTILLVLIGIIAIGDLPNRYHELNVPTFITRTGDTNYATGLQTPPHTPDKPNNTDTQTCQRQRWETITL